MAQYLCNWTRPVSVLLSNKHSCLLYILGHLGIFLPLFCFGSPDLILCTSCGSDVLSFELERDWRYAASECICLLCGPENMVFLGAALHWSQLLCCMAQPAQTILCTMSVSCDAEGTLEKDYALHINCSYTLCPQMQPQCVHVCSWSSFHCSTACTQSVPKSNIKVQYRTLIASLCILLVDKKDILKVLSYLWRQCWPVNQSMYQPFAFWKVDSSLCTSTREIRACLSYLFIKESLV